MFIPRFSLRVCYKVCDETLLLLATNSCAPVFVGEIPQSVSIALKTFAHNHLFGV